jgi:nicotinamidase-related amidase
MTSPLVIIDMQKIFKDSSSQWCVSDYDSAAENIVELVLAHSGPIIWTKFVRDPSERGAWGEYYKTWDQCRLPPNSPEWNLTFAVQSEHKLLTCSTFSKWGEELEALTEFSGEIIICGVATDQCVLGTVLGAIDAGKKVVVIEDCCAGLTKQAHDQAIDILSGFRPMVEITTTSEFIEKTSIEDKCS